MNKRQLKRAVNSEKWDPNEMDPLVAEKHNASLRRIEGCIDDMPKILAADHREKISEALKGNKNGTGNKNAKGKSWTLSAETKEKMRQAALNRKKK